MPESVRCGFADRATVPVDWLVWSITCCLYEKIACGIFAINEHFVAISLVHVFAGSVILRCLLGNVISTNIEMDLRKVNCEYV